ncbi:Lpg1974 family pore-forming outer membrane protein [Thalassobium sp. R2A62]|uniref:Lpg1974 family pore-forming outer membrane protein n=1 Tax=Thalassobium sp. R2A62 TaxID=633131 RepID=UPI0001B1D424|nr:Lpg1974 family pore-forming outer membrane protein [Thalassobium sp. R2A62]EET49017.1 hypothetical protein TR2A62_0253 [Thalassobium sp. R2A62]
MNRSLIIIPSTAALGALGAGVSPATAQDVGELTFSVDFGAGSGDFSNELYSEKFGADGFDEFDSDRAFAGSVGLSGSFDTTWDWALSVSQTDFEANVFLVEDGGDSFSLNNDGGNRTQAGFTVGQTFRLGSSEARFGLGLAYANANSSSSLSFSETTNKGLNSIDAETESEFQGIGPRMTLDAESAPISSDGRFTIVGGADVNYLAGQYTHSKGLNAFEDDEFSSMRSSVSQDGELLTAGAYVGIKYAVSDATAVRFGVRRDMTSMEHVTYEGDDAISTVRSGLTSAYIGMDVNF